MKLRVTVLVDIGDLHIDYYADQLLKELHKVSNVRVEFVELEERTEVRRTPINRKRT